MHRKGIYSRGEWRYKKKGGIWSKALRRTDPVKILFVLFAILAAFIIGHNLPLISAIDLHTRHDEKEISEGCSCSDKKDSLLTLTGKSND